MHHQATPSPIWAIESNSISNSANTPKRKKRRNWFQNFLELQLSISDKKPGQFDLEVVGFAEASTTKISPLSKELKGNIAFYKGRKICLSVTRNFDAKTLNPDQRWSFSRAMQELLTLRDVERELKISRTTVWRLRKLGLIKTSALGGIIRIHRRDLDRFMAYELLAGRSR